MVLVGRVIHKSRILVLHPSFEKMRDEVMLRFGVGSNWLDGHGGVVRCGMEQLGFVLEALSPTETRVTL